MPNSEKLCYLRHRPNADERRVPVEQVDAAAWPAYEQGPRLKDMRTVESSLETLVRAPEVSEPIMNSLISIKPAM